MHSASSPHTGARGLGLGCRGQSVEPLARVNSGFSLSPAPLLGHVLTHLVIIACKKHRTGAMDDLFHVDEIRSVGILWPDATSARACTFIGSFSQAEPPENPRMLGLGR